MSIVTLNDRAVRSVTAFGSLNTGSMVFIKKLTASSSATLSFVDGSSDVVLDDTYKEYIFTFKNIHPATNRSDLTFNMSSDSGSNYNVTKTTSFFRTTHTEDDATTVFSYVDSYDLAQGTGGQPIGFDIGNAGDASCSGELYLFSPSNTTFVKHFIANTNRMTASNSAETFVSGYGNTTSAVDAVDFAISSGTIDSGVIKMYGLRES